MDGRAKVLHLIQLAVLRLHGGSFRGGRLRGPPPENARAVEACRAVVNAVLDAPWHLRDHADQADEAVRLARGGQYLEAAFALVSLGGDLVED